MTAQMAVMGLGVTGRAVAEALLRRNVAVVALDDSHRDELASWAHDLGLELLRPGETDLDELLRSVDAVVPAPGLPDRHQVFGAAARAGTPVLSEFDLAAQWDGRPVIAITGTDGKTTTVTLVERMLRSSGINALAVGNTDVPYVEAIDDPEINIFVVEASSFRLGHSRRFSPQVATWLNFGPDHLDVHDGLAAYERAKASIWAHLEPGAVAIANRDDPVVLRNAMAIEPGSVVVETFGLDAPCGGNGHGVANGQLILSGAALVPVTDLQRALPHDVSNALAAAASATQLGADRDAIADVLRSFTGLEHRVQLVAEIDGVRYINDSKATTPHAAAAALSGLESVVLLAGGKNKGLAFDDMMRHVDRITHVVAIGESAADIETVFGPYVPVSTAASMQTAVELAQTLAVPGDVVLLSPACASFDWYRSYRDRGDDFARVVRSLQESETP